MKKYFNRFYNKTNIFKNLTKKMGNNRMAINSFYLRACKPNFRTPENWIYYKTRKEYLTHPW